ncbi:MAG: hypothetical protein ACRC41_16565, partial [Sarcina sp.]
KSGKSLFEPVYEEYTGSNGLKRKFSQEIGLTRFIKIGIKNENNISDEKVNQLYQNTYLGEIYTLTI